MKLAVQSSEGCSFEISSVKPALDLINALKTAFLAVNSSISGGAGSKLQCTVYFGNQSGM